MNILEVASLVAAFAAGALLAIAVVENGVQRLMPAIHEELVEIRTRVNHLRALINELDNRVTRDWSNALDRATKAEAELSDLRRTIYSRENVERALFGIDRAQIQK